MPPDPQAALRADLRADLRAASAEGLGGSRACAATDPAARAAHILGRIRATILPRRLCLAGPDATALTLEVANGRALAFAPGAEGPALAPLGADDLPALAAALARVVEGRGAIDIRASPLPDGLPTRATGIGAAQLEAALVATLGAAPADPASAPPAGRIDRLTRLLPPAGCSTPDEGPEALVTEGDILIVGPGAPGEACDFAARDGGRWCLGTVPATGVAEVIATWCAPRPEA